MSSPAAAAISAMITSQVYPQMWRPASHPARGTWAGGRQPKGRSMFSKGNTKAIGSIQFLIGVGVLGTFCFASMYERDIPRVTIAMSVLSSIVCIISGLVSAFAKGSKLIRAALVANALCSMVTLVSVVICSVSLSPACGWCNARTSAIVLGLLLFLSSLILLITALSIVHCYKALHHTDTQESVASRHSWRDGLTRKGDEKMLSTFILAPEPKNPATQQP